MIDLLEQASAWLNQQREQFTSRAVTYARGEAAVELTAALGRTVFQVENSFGVIERSESRDYLIPTQALVLSGAATLPQRGDRVRETTGGQTFVYEVLAPGNEPHWRYSDPWRQTLRVHTRHVATEASA